MGMFYNLLICKEQQRQIHKKIIKSVHIEFFTQKKEAGIWKSKKPEILDHQNRCNIKSENRGNRQNSYS